MSTDNTAKTPATKTARKQVSTSLSAEQHEQFEEVQVALRVFKPSQLILTAIKRLAGEAGVEFTVSDGDVADVARFLK